MVRVCGDSWDVVAGEVPCTPAVLITVVVPVAVLSTRIVAVDPAAAAAAAETATTLPVATVPAGSIVCVPVVVRIPDGCTFIIFIPADIGDIGEDTAIVVVELALAELLANPDPLAGTPLTRVGVIRTI